MLDNALEKMPWPELTVGESYRMFKSKLRFQIRFVLKLSRVGSIS